MKPLFYSIMVLFIGSCKYFQFPQDFTDPAKSKIEAEAFIDSLRNSDSLPIIGYYQGCSGCISGTDKRFFIFYSLDTLELTGKLTRFTNYSEPKTINIFHFPSDYLLRQIDHLEEDSIIYQDGLLHGRYDRFLYISEKDSISYGFMNNHIHDNINSHHVHILDKLRSYLFSIQEEKWNSKK